MQVYNYLKLFLVIIQTVIAMPKKQDTCPGSPAWKHAKCKMLVTFQNNCSAVASEIILRLTSSAWIDPHNQGTYELLSQHENLISGQRITGGGQYTDLFTFSLDPGSDRNSGSCQVTACSESQVFSILDFSTNYCNLRNLYCNSEEGCCPLGHELIYEENYVSCGQKNVKKCIVDVDVQ